MIANASRAGAMRRDARRAMRLDPNATRGRIRPDTNAMRCRALIGMAIAIAAFSLLQVVLPASVAAQPDGTASAAIDPPGRLFWHVLCGAPAGRRAGLRRKRRRTRRTRHLSTNTKGHPEPPRAEAAYTRAYLKAHPNTRLAPYLWLVIAHRSRVLFEIAVDQRDREGQRAAADDYRDALQHARVTTDPLVRAAIDNLDRQPYVYIPSPAVSATRPAAFR